MLRPALNQQREPLGLLGGLLHQVGDVLILDARPNERVDRSHPRGVALGHGDDGAREVPLAAPSSDDVEQDLGDRGRAQMPGLDPTGERPVAFYRWLFAGRGRGKPVVNPGDLVVVPYLGSGPEIPAAMELGLDVIGIEIEREYLDTAIKHRIGPAIARGKQIDLWAPRPRREEQTALFNASQEV